MIFSHYAHLYSKGNDQVRESDAMRMSSGIFHDKLENIFNDGVREAVFRHRRFGYSQYESEIERLHRRFFMVFVQIDDGQALKSIGELLDVNIY